VTDLVRFGVSIEQKLLSSFDRLIRRENYTNRSEAIRDLIRQELVRDEWDSGHPVAGAITLVYDHHSGDLMHRLTGIQHGFQELIISTQHIHLDHHNCLEIIAVKGEPGKVRKLSDMLRSLKGVKHGTLSMSGLGEDL
jgi:CopG family nickel-responsive transcriptional regulator